MKARIELSDDEFSPIVPLLIPNLDDVREQAQSLHEKGEEWYGELFGWSAEYHPERSEPPIDSKMSFTPADFCIGESGIWFFSLMWEKGKDMEPEEFLDERGFL
ncbi:MAG: hypothetical protein F6K62_25105 [Sphaerospermopsis sp. SIO1G2]|nr:hypothetical protein [Sphaerospermopsis sp. SIO1G2]